MASQRPPFDKLLVANRGEIALRVIRAARDLGVHSVAVYSDADGALPHVRHADESCRIGPAPARDSYLNIDNIIAAAKRTGAQAIHPGYGFLAENPRFVRACDDAGITFIGPSAASMEQMGNKIEARRSMKAAGVPIVPGTIDPLSDEDEARKIADEIGYPIMIKASAGGGGKGIRVVREERELGRAMTAARDEARAAFGDGSVFVEKFIQPARHIEIQLIADQHGNLVTLGERECSIQRRRQKLIEECPSMRLTPQLRASMERAAHDAARACGYYSAGTVEFLVYGDNEFAFLEMNARLQVEHPVTEMVRGVDIVADQIRIAAGQPLGYEAADRPIRGWAMECRITAEDPYNGFLPTIGPISHYREPSGPGVRVESMLYPGMSVSMHYDSLLAKLVTWGEDREQCRQRMRRALREFTIVGVSTSIPFHLAMLDDPNFISGDIDTDYAERTINLSSDDRPQTTETAALAAAAFLRRFGERPLPRATGDGGSGNAWATAARGRRTGLEQRWRRG